MAQCRTQAELGPVQNSGRSLHRGTQHVRRLFRNDSTLRIRSWRRFGSSSPFIARPSALLGLYMLPAPRSELRVPGNLMEVDGSIPLVYISASCSISSPVALRHAAFFLADPLPSSSKPNLSLQHGGCPLPPRSHPYWCLRVLSPGSLFP